MAILTTNQPTSEGGAGCRAKLRLVRLEGEVFSLDIPLIEQPVLVKRLQPLLASRPEKDFARRRRPVLLTHYEGAPFQSRL
jgi:hypothetical protein